MHRPAAQRGPAPGPCLSALDRPHQSHPPTRLQPWTWTAWRGGAALPGAGPDGHMPGTCRREWEAVLRHSGSAPRPRRPSRPTLPGVSGTLAAACRRCLHIPVAQRACMRRLDGDSTATRDPCRPCRPAGPAAPARGRKQQRTAPQPVGQAVRGMAQRRKGAKPGLALPPCLRRACRYALLRAAGSKALFETDAVQVPGAFPLADAHRRHRHAINLGAVEELLQGEADQGGQRRHGRPRSI